MAARLTFHLTLLLVLLPLLEHAGGHCMQVRLTAAPDKHAVLQSSSAHCHHDPTDFTVAAVPFLFEGPQHGSCMAAAVSSHDAALSCTHRSMRRWDEEGEPEEDAVQFGDFLIKCGMARMPNTPALLVMNASFLIEAKKDGQAARTQLQLAQKATPSLLDNYNIYVANQLSKQLTRGAGSGLAQDWNCHAPFCH
jgi:hypothetical protein